MWSRWKRRAAELRRETLALYYACRDPRVPWHARLLAAGVVAYALSPVDLIPDFVPVLGYVDDLVLLPLGFLAVRAMVPPAVMEECREKALRLESAPRNWIAGGVIVAIWLAFAVMVLRWASA